MAARTFAPQMARMLQRVVKYQAKHAAKINAVASASQQTDLATIVAAINNSWVSVPVNEQP